MDTGDWTETLSPTPDILQAVSAALMHSDHKFDHALADYFIHYTTTYAALNPLVLLGAVVQPREAPPDSEWRDEDKMYFLYHSMRPPSALEKARRWGIGFIAEFLQELRNILCGPKKSHRKLSDKFQAALAFLTAALSKKLGIDNPTALGMALLVLLSLPRASKKAFCKMTDQEVLEALAEGE
jgi:hypothetical protein